MAVTADDLRAMPSMPGNRDDSTVYSPRDAGLEDMYPTNSNDHQKLLTWTQNAFTAARQARDPFEKKWARYYRLRRSYVKHVKGDWRSKVFVPIAFWVIEAIAPRMVSNLPKFIANPMGPEDVLPAKVMEQMLGWSAQQSNLYVELVKMAKSSLTYGTGIAKTYNRQDTIRGRRLVDGPPRPVFAPSSQPIIDPETNMPLMSPDGTPIQDNREVFMGVAPQGKVWQPYTYDIYNGPAAECIDIFNFWPAPEATDIQNARYVIDRRFRSLDYVLNRINEGAYRLPQWINKLSLNETNSLGDDPAMKRLASVLYGSATMQDPTMRPCELLEYWTDDGRVITVLNRRIILRAHENPYDHGQKPYAKIVDYLWENEFWGSGELEAIEGLQDVQNVLTNLRIDNLRLETNKMWVVNTKAVYDKSDLRSRPGGIIRVKDDLPIQDVIWPVPFGSPTSTAFQESSMVESTVERTTGVSGYQLGTDAPSMNDTATGVSLIQEAGSNRFMLKVKLSELMGLRDIARQFGGMILQYVDREKIVRLIGPDGAMAFATITPESLAGSYDFDIESQASTLTESQRRGDALNLLEKLANYVPAAIPILAQEVWEAFGKRGPLMPGMTPVGMAQFMGPMAQPGMPQPGMPGLPPGMAPPPGLAQAAALPPGAPAGLPQFQAPAPIMPMQRMTSPTPSAVPTELFQRGPAR